MYFGFVVCSFGGSTASSAAVILGIVIHDLSTIFNALSLPPSLSSESGGFRK